MMSIFIFQYLVLLREEWGLRALVVLVVFTELNDVFQYVMGKSSGKRKITPEISRNKTWAGVIGGVILTIVLSNILGYFLLSSDIIANTGLGLILGVSGFFGDIFM